MGLRMGTQEDLDARTQALLQQSQGQFQQGLDAGRARGQELFGGGQNLQAMTGDVIRGQQALSQGIMDPNFAALRARMAQGIQGQLQQNLGAIQGAQAAAGVSGPAAIAQQQRAMTEAQRAIGRGERDLVADDLAVRQQGLQALSNTINRERLGQLGTEFGMANMRAQQLSGARQQALGERNLAGIQGLLRGRNPMPLPTGSLMVGPGSISDNINKAGLTAAPVGEIPQINPLGTIGR